MGRLHNVLKIPRMTDFIKIAVDSFDGGRLGRVQNIGDKGRDRKRSPWVSRTRVAIFIIVRVR